MKMMCWFAWKETKNALPEEPQIPYEKRLWILQWKETEEPLDKKMDSIYSIEVLFHSCTSGCGSVWLERYLREVEAACSNHVTPIKKTVETIEKSMVFTVFY